MKMKRIITFCLCAIICLNFIGCSDSSDISVPMGMQIASDSDVPNYVLMVPNDWTIESTAGTTTASYRDNLSNQALASFSATFNVAENSSVTAQSYFDSFVEEYTQTFGAPENITSEPYRLDGKEAMEFTYTATFGGEEYKFWQVICIHEGLIYTLTYSATTTYYDNYVEDMHLILTNFHFK